MDPLYFKVPRLKEDTIKVEYWDLPHFFDPVHFHEDCQLTVILKGEGSIIANGSIDTFSKGDIFAFGKNVPHVLRNDKRYYEDDSVLKAKAISIFFDHSIYLNVFDQIPVWGGIKKLVEAMGVGLKIHKEDGKVIKKKIKLLHTLEGADRVILFIDILFQCSKSKRIMSLSGSMLKMGHPDSSVKLNQVYEYLLDNYMNQVKLEDVANLINMSPNAFCRFFKNRTNKTLSGILIEIRIKKVCKMLAEGNCNVTETYLSNGYNNSSNFHRHFRSVTGMTPVEYKEVIRSKN